MSQIIKEIPLSEDIVNMIQKIDYEMVGDKNLLLSLIRMQNCQETQIAFKDAFNGDPQFTPVNLYETFKMNYDKKIAEFKLMLDEIILAYAPEFVGRKDIEASVHYNKQMLILSSVMQDCCKPERIGR